MKGYRLIDEGTLKITIHRDLIFNESDFQRDSTAVEVSEKVNGDGKDENILVERLEQPQTEEREDVKEDHNIILGDRELYQSGMESRNILVLHF